MYFILLAEYLPLNLYLITNWIWLYNIVYDHNCAIDQAIFSEGYRRYLALCLTSSQFVSAFLFLSTSRDVVRRRTV